MDAEIDWSHPIAGQGFSARVLLNYQPHLIYDLRPAPIVDVGGAADGVDQLAATPNIKGVLQLNYEVVSNLTATVQAQVPQRDEAEWQQSLFLWFGKCPRPGIPT